LKSKFIMRLRSLTILSLFAASALAQSVAITQYPAGIGTYTIATGPDGAIWAGSDGGLTIVRMTTAGVVTNRFTVPATGYAKYLITNLIAGPDGNLWFQLQLYNTQNYAAGLAVVRMTPTGSFSYFPLLTPGSGAFEGGLIVGPDNAIWFGESNQTTGWVGRMTTDGTITAEYQLPGQYFVPAGLTTGPDGAVWFIEEIQYPSYWTAGEPVGKIGRVATGGTLTEFPFPLSEYSYSTGIRTGSDGNLWFSYGGLVSGTLQEKVVRMTVKGVLAEFPLASGRGISGLTLGPDGDIWFVGTDQGEGNPEIDRITPAGFVTLSSLPIYTQPLGIIVGPDGLLWIADEGNSTIDQIRSLIPNLTSITPPSATACGPPFALNASGTGFLTGASIGIGADPTQLTALTSSSASATQVTATVPASMLQAPGTLNVAVLNPGATSGTFAASNRLTFTVNPPPAIQQISPTSATAGSGAFQIQATIANYVPGVTAVLWNGGQALEVLGTAPSGIATVVTLQVPANLIPSLARTVSLNPVNVDSANPSGLTYTSACDAPALLTFAAPLPPPISVASVVNSASNVPGAIAPGEIVVLYGSGLGPAQLAVAAPGATGFYSTQLAGASVSFGGIAAPVIYASATQLAAVVPYGVTGATVAITPSYGGHTSAAISVALAPSAPALFTADSSGTGTAAVINQDGSYNGPAHPANAGDVILLFATGDGLPNPAQSDGQIVGLPLPSPVLPVTLTIGGISAHLDYAGGAPGEIAGMMQINAQVPAGLPAGPVPVLLQVGSAASPSGVTLNVSGN
jgi:uncharacterized protein (TIGR03437 family)